MSVVESLVRFARPAIDPLALWAPSSAPGTPAYQGLADGTYTVFVNAWDPAGLLVARKVVTIASGAAVSVTLGRANAVVVPWK